MGRLQLLHLDSLNSQREFYKGFSLCAYYEIPNHEFHSGYLQLWMDYSHQVWTTCTVALTPLDSSPQTLNSGTEL